MLVTGALLMSSGQLSFANAEGTISHQTVTEYSQISPEEFYGNINTREGAGGILPEPNRFQSLTDRPHISTSEGPRAVSVHGWWDRVSGPAELATVRIELWAKGPNDPGFRKVGEETKSSTPPGGGRGKRAAARAECKNNDLTTFRGDVDADIEGYPDVPGIVRGQEVSLPCGV